MRTHVDHSYDDEDDELIADSAAPETAGDPTAWAAADAADHPLALPPPPTATAVEAEEAARMVAAHLQQGLGIPRFSTLFDGRAGTCALERKRPRGQPPAAWSSSVAVAESAEAQLLGKAHKGRRHEVQTLGDAYTAAEARILGKRVGGGSHGGEDDDDDDDDDGDDGDDDDDDDDDDGQMMNLISW